MNYNIIEEHDTLNYEQFKIDYQNIKIPVKKIKEKYNIGTSRYNNLVREVREETHFTRSTRNKINPKHYSKRGNGFIVQKRLGGECISFGQYKNEETTKEIVKRIKKCNWDKTRLLEIKDQMKKEGYKF